MTNKNYKLEYSLLFTLLLLILFLNVWNNDFPLGYHVDEIKKVHFILTNTQDFYHPILMLQLNRLVNGFLHLNSPSEVVILGRTLSTIAGAVIVLFTYLIARRILPKLAALFAAFSVAVSPMLVVHAHYLKEDLLLGAAFMFAL